MRCFKKENSCYYRKQSIIYINFKTINDIMSGRHPFKDLELSPSDIKCFKCAPITLVDVEQSLLLSSLNHN